MANRTGGRDSLRGQIISYYRVVEKSGGGGLSVLHGRGHSVAPGFWPLSCCRKKSPRSSSDSPLPKGGRGRFRIKSSTVDARMPAMLDRVLQELGRRPRQNMELL